jgi:hypothetical protein
MPTKTRNRSRSTSQSRSSGGSNRSRKASPASQNEAPVAARQRFEETGLGEDVAKEQEKAQADALNNPPRAQRSSEPENVAEARAPSGVNGVGPVEARVDQLTSRGPGDVLQGHFCTIDRTHKDLSDQVTERLAGVDGYGVYLEPAEIGEDGYPVSALVRLRDDSHAVVQVPYAALRPAEPRGR